MTKCRIFSEEQRQLRALDRPFSGYFERSCRVSTTCTVAYDRNRYSVPAEYAGQRVSLRATANAIRVMVEGVQIADHQRCFGREQQILDPWHYLPLLERKPGALRNGAPFQNWQLPEPIEHVKQQLIKQVKGDQAFVEVLMAVHKYGQEQVGVACELALEHRTISAAIVLNYVYRLSAETTVQSVPVADNLLLRQEPQADCARYDQLRGHCHGT